MNDATPVLIAGARTSIGRLGGRLSRHAATDLGAAVVRAVLRRCPGLAPEYVALGNVVQAGNGQNPARVAAVRGGVSREVAGVTVNDVCLASMTAVVHVARMIGAGEVTTGLAGGFESMSRAPLATAVRRRRGTTADQDRGEPVDLLEHDGLWCSLDQVGMGVLSDRENERLGIGRAEQDAFAAESHRRAHHATVTGRFAHEIDASGLDAPPADDGIRPHSTAASLRALPPAFTPDGTITAGNASQLSDAAAAGMLARADRAKALGLPTLAVIEGWANVAGRDSSLHLMPAAAARRLLERRGLTTSDVGLWEINEAFAGVVLASTDDLGIDLDNVNVNGGAIALGHPLGASGFRLVLTLAIEMRRRDVEWGVAAICGGGGQGEALLLRQP
ncbi:acetyl-CoA C-acyltransferase [Jiangella asiatica]|uniref:acetyl-CoA C-acyltransferase n=1 Tax=Jiangella asiatica TaxID=2530372 RepID=UPI00193D3F44|nr:acetyl-CoA C-acyltransferase [Jiangella asiatica]